MSKLLYSDDENQDSFSGNSENEYDPSQYANNFEDENEVWGDVDSAVDYKSPMPVVPRTKPEPKKPQPILSAPKPSIINQKYFNLSSGPKPEPKVKTPSIEETLAEMAKGKIEELNQWLYKAKKEAEKNSRFRNNLSEKVKSFNKAKEELETFEESVMKEIQEFNENELEKLKREVKVHERNQKMMANLPSKKDREEIEMMKNLMSKIKEEASIKHNRYKLNKDRVSKLIEEAKQKKKELIKRLETLDTLTNKTEQFREPVKEIPASINKNIQVIKSEDKEINHVDYTFNPEDFERITQQLENISKTPKLTPNEAKNEVSQSPQNLHKASKISSMPPKPPQSDLGKQNSSFTPDKIIKPNQEISSNNEKYLKTESKSAESAHTPEISEKIPLLDHKTFPDGRILKLYESGHRETIFPNNTRKEEYPNGYSVLFYANKDIKQVFPDGRIVYYYSEQSTSHTSYPDGSKLIRFGTGQTEKHYQDGSKKIKYLDGTIKKISASGDQETIYPDSTLELVLANGSSSVFHPGGHKEIQLNGSKKRVYFNGTSKSIL